ncbi:hypothetical protein CLU79DRAFT_742071 [Phycomyces nitens]|nr:hypothetical protein CLU79DRAFT_742071 [Phycomyces nitens]
MARYQLARGTVIKNRRVHTKGTSPLTPVMKPEERYKNLATGIERNIEKLKLQLESNGTSPTKEPIRRGRQPPERTPSVRRPPIRRGGAASKANEPVLVQLTAEYERLRQVRLDYVVASQQMHQQRKTTLMKDRQDDIAARQKEFEEEVEKAPRKVRNNIVTPLQACKKLLRILERVDNEDLSDDSEDVENLPVPSEPENTEIPPIYGPSVTPERLLETPMGSYMESDDEIEVLMTVSTTPSIASTTPSMISPTMSTEYVASPSPIPGRGTPRGPPRGVTPMRTTLKAPPPPRGRTPVKPPPPSKPAWGRPPVKPPVKPPVGTPRERARTRSRAATGTPVPATPTTPITPIAPVPPPIPAPLGAPPPPVTRLEPLGLPEPVKPVITKEDLTITVVRIDDEDDYEDVDADLRDPLDGPDPDAIDTTMLVIPLAVRELFWIAEIEAPVCHSEIEGLINRIRTKLELEETE